MIIEVEIYKVVRKLTIEGMSQRAIAQKLGISRQTVKKYSDGDTAPENRKEYDRLAGVFSPDILAFIESCFETDAEENIPKQKHIAACVSQTMASLQGEYGTSLEEIFKSITSDNGSEYADLSYCMEDTSTQVYYAHPYSS